MSDQFDSVRVVTERQAIELTGLGRRTWYRLRAKGELPPRTRLSERRVGYRLLDLREWMAKQSQPIEEGEPFIDLDSGPPTQLYRHFDADGTLLYVGISLSALQRLRGHRAAEWIDRIT